MVFKQNLHINIDICDTGLTVLSTEGDVFS